MCYINLLATVMLVMLVLTQDISTEFQSRDRVTYEAFHWSTPEEKAFSGTSEASSNANCTQLKGNSELKLSFQWRNCLYDREDQTKVAAPLSYSAQRGLSNITAQPLALRTRTVRDTSRDIWQCLLRRAQPENLKRSAEKNKVLQVAKICSTGESAGKSNVTHIKEMEEGKDYGANDCMPLLFVFFPSLCNETRLCVNLTQAVLEAFHQRSLLWNKKKNKKDESDEAVIYIVVVLSFYSFGIVFMMANFIRQEQREIEETKLYKQYVKVAREPLVTSRGNLANKLALQALNTFNAVPQTTDDSKITFV